METSYASVFGTQRSNINLLRDTSLDQENYSIVKLQKDQEVPISVYLECMKTRDGKITEIKDEILPAIKSYIKYDDKVEISLNVNDMLKAILSGKGRLTPYMINLQRIISSIFGKAGTVDIFGVYSPTSVTDIHDPSNSELKQILLALQRMCQVYLQNNVLDVHVESSQRRLLSLWKKVNYDRIIAYWFLTNNSNTHGAVSGDPRYLRNYLMKFNYFSWASTPNNSFGGVIEYLKQALIGLYFINYGSFSSKRTTDGHAHEYALPNVNFKKTQVMTGKSCEARDAFITSELLIYLLRGWAPVEMPIFTR